MGRVGHTLGWGEKAKLVGELSVIIHPVLLINSLGEWGTLTRNSWAGAGDGNNRYGEMNEASARNINDADPAIYQLDSSARAARGSLV